MTMSWSKCIYLYHKERGGLFLGGSLIGQLIFNEDNGPMTVSYYLPEGRYGVSRIQIRTMLKLEGDYEVEISPKSGGLTSLLNRGGRNEALGRRVRSSDEEMTARLLADPALTAALTAFPDCTVEVADGPENTLVLQVYSFSPERVGSPWPICATDNDYARTIPNEDEIRTLFFPRLDGLLEVARSARRALDRL